MLCWLPFAILCFAYLSKIIHSPHYIVKTVYRLGFLFMILLLVKNEFGTDIDSYRSYYHEIDKNGYYLNLELGYKYIMIFFKYFFIDDFFLFMFVLNTFTMFSFYKMVNKYSRNIILSTLIFYSLYYFLYPASALRQCLAIGFTIYSIDFIVNKKAKEFYCFVACAILCHYSAILFLPIYYLANRIMIPTKIAIVLVLCSLPLMLIDLTPILGTIVSSLGGMDKYAELYLDKDGIFNEKVAIGIGVIVKLFFFISFALTYNKENRIEHILFNIYLVYLLLYFPLSSVSIISSRGLDYYKIFDCLMLTYVLYNTRSILYRNIFAIFLFSYMIYSLSAVTYKYDKYPSLLNSILNL